MSTIYGQSLSCAAAGAKEAALKWTVSLTEPAAPEQGNLWVKADPASVQVEKVIQLQSASKKLENMEPNTLYVLVPEEGYPLSSEPPTVEYFNSDKYALRLKCPHILLTDSTGEERAVPRGVYTGTAWKMFGLVPEKPTGWQFLTAIAADQVWTPPEENAWYRVFVFGKCGDGGARAGSGITNNLGGSGGNSGGVAASVLLGSEIQNTVCTINESITSFGEHLSATSGGNGQTNGYVNAVVGEGSGGTEYNLTGYKGGAGVRSQTKQTPRGGSGENGGMTGGLQGDAGYNYEDDDGKTHWTWLDHYGGGGAGGARLPSPYAGFPYIPDSISNFVAGQGAYVSSGEYPRQGANAQSFPALDLSNPVLYGGGGGAGGNISFSGLYWGGLNSAGSPGLIIIEKGVRAE